MVGVRVGEGMGEEIIAQWVRKATSSKLSRKGGVRECVRGRVPGVCESEQVCGKVSEDQMNDFGKLQGNRNCGSGVGSSGVRGKHSVCRRVCELLRAGTRRARETRSKLGTGCS